MDKRHVLESLHHQRAVEIEVIARDGLHDDGHAMAEDLRRESARKEQRHGNRHDRAKEAGGIGAPYEDTQPSEERNREDEDQVRQCKEGDRAVEAVRIPEERLEVVARRRGAKRRCRSATPASGPLTTMAATIRGAVLGFPTGIGSMWS